MVDGSEIETAATVADAVRAEEIGRALVIMLRHHGDVLLTTPVFSVLASHAPQAEIDALIYAETRDMLTLHPAVSRIHEIDRRWGEHGTIARLQNEWRLFAALRSRSYDLIVHLSENPRGAFLARMLGPRAAVARHIGSRGRTWHRSFTHLYLLPRGTQRHTVERNLDALRRLGMHPSPAARRLVLVPGEQADREADRILHENRLQRDSYIHMHAVSRWKFKCWPVARNAELIDRLADAGWKVVLTAAPDQTEIDFNRRICAATHSRPVDLSGKLTLKQTAALTARAALFVGVDSAPMHIAAAVGTPAVALFGPSSDVEWGPWMVPHRIVASATHPCRPCRIDGCGGSKVSDCLVTLDTETAFRACVDLLRKRGTV